MIVPLGFIVRLERLLTKLIFFEQNHSTKMFAGALFAGENKEELVMLSEEIKTEKRKRRKVIQSETLFLLQLPILNQYKSIFLHPLRIIF